MIVGDNIKKYRQAANMSQESLAKRLNVTQQAVDSWERLNSMPRRKTIDRLSKIFNVTPNELFGYDDKLPDEDNQPAEINNQISAEDLELLQKIKKLPPEKKKAIEILVSDDKQSMVVNK